MNYYLVGTLFIILVWFIMQQAYYYGNSGITFTKHLRLKRKVMPYIKMVVRYPWELVGVSKVGMFDPNKAPYKIDLKVMNVKEIKIKEAKVTFYNDGEIGEETLTEAMKNDI